jgi:hypothetical protein
MKKWKTKVKIERRNKYKKNKENFITRIMLLSGIKHLRKKGREKKDADKKEDKKLRTNLKEREQTENQCCGSASLFWRSGSDFSF